jgi:hypothetical protein
VQRRGAKGNQRLAPGLGESLAEGPGDPLGQHRQHAARLLVLRQALPLPLEDRERRGVERVARLEAGLQVFLRLTLTPYPSPSGRGEGEGVHGGPLRRQLRPPLEAPVGELLGYAAGRLHDALVVRLAEVEVLEQPAARPRCRENRFSNSSKSRRTGPSTLAISRLIVSVPGGASRADGPRMATPRSPSPPPRRDRQGAAQPPATPRSPSSPPIRDRQGAAQPPATPRSPSSPSRARLQTPFLLPIADGLRKNPKRRVRAAAQDEGKGGVHGVVECAAPWRSRLR